MSNSIKGPFIALVFGVVIILSLYFFTPIFNDWKQKNTSDAKDVIGTITVGVDGWVGYYPFCSKKMSQEMRKSGHILKCIDDKADYASRMSKLKSGELNLALATVDSYILNAQPVDFPATIITVIDESKGGDAILASGNIKNLNDLKKTTNYKIAFTPKSPSEHLLMSVGTHFDIAGIKNSGKWRIETNGSTEALEKLLKGEVQVAVLWEPEVSKALGNQNIHKLIGTEDTKNLIVDILLGNREFLQDNPELIKMILTNYFITLKYYRDNPEILKQEVSGVTKLSTSQVESMLKGVEWATLEDNAQKWFGVRSSKNFTSQELSDTINETVKILVENKKFPNNPLPNEDSYRIINSEFVKDLDQNGITGQFKTASTSEDQVSSLEQKFALLNEAEWKNLQEKGTLKVLPIIFQSGTSDLDLEGKMEIDKGIKNLEHYPKYRVVIKGHTNLNGEPEINKTLSFERADSVARYIVITYRVDPNRLRVIGMGSEEPLSRNIGESDRSYDYRLPRVEMFLFKEVY
jgi:outer membrane protein OmpA-like peptidoglycan-associated protein